MKTYINLRFFSLVFILLFTFSCKDYLEVTPKDELSTESVFQSEAGADLFLNSIYDYQPDVEKRAGNDRFNKGGPNYDNMEFLAPWYVGRHRFITSIRRSEDRALNADSRSGKTGYYNHNYPAVIHHYEVLVQIIRSCNFFIESIEENKENYSDEWFTMRKAEARSLRAFFYHYVWMAYGGVPLITEVLNKVQMGDDIFQPSVSTRELYEFMVKELDEAADNLPNKIGNGHVTQGGALALKAWIHLYMGDIARDPKPSAVGAPDMGYATAAYNACAETCQDIIDLGTYNLFPKYHEMFLGKNNNNSESMWAYQHMAQDKPNGRTVHQGPRWSQNSSNHAGAGAPTQQLVDLYRMGNGLPITHAESGYNPVQPYKNREQRFYESVVHDSSYYAGALFTLEGIGDAETLREGGKRVTTGYFRRKGVDPTLTSATFNDEDANTMYFRYTEVLLNYVEAKIKAGAVDGTAMDLLDQVRERGGIPSVVESYGTSLAGMAKQEQEDLIWNERVIEMTWEHKSYWDIVRWRKAGQYLNQPLHGVNRDPAGGYKTFVIHNQKWDDDKYYLFPLYRGWLERNPVWMDPANQSDGRTAGQNPGY
jgi:hypothetical protein